METRDLMPLLGQPVFRTDPAASLDRFPVAKRIDTAGFYIGCHPYLTDDELGWVLESFRDYFRG